MSLWRSDMEASQQAREQQAKDNARAKEKVAELQEFVRRFSANKSKARQATSRAKQIDKIKIEEFKPSSRAYPFVRFEGEKKLHRLAVETEGLSKSYDRTLFKNFSIMWPTPGCNCSSLSGIRSLRRSELCPKSAIRSWVPAMITAGTFNSW